MPMMTGRREQVRVPRRNCLQLLRLEDLTVFRPRMVTGAERSQSHSQRRGAGTNNSSTSNTNTSSLSSTSGVSLRSMTKRRR